MGLKIGGKVEKVNGKELTYVEFVEKYLDRNHPVILTGLTGDWPACRDWVSADGKPNLQFFSDHFGGSRVQEDTISINHNWFSAYNISWVWDLLLREYHEAVGYIEDLKDICDDFEGLCQRNLAANAGMDFRDFFIFMVRFALANFVLLYQLTSSKGFINGSSSEMTQLLLFNLKNMKCITLKMKSEASWQNRGIAAIDLVQTIKDQSFMEFCNTLGRKFSMMCNLGDINFNQSCPLLEYEQISVLYPFGSHICNPDNLVTFLDYAFKLVDTEG